MNIEAKTVDDSRVETVHLVMSGHLNGAGRLFGGILMQWIFSPSQIHIEEKYDYIIINGTAVNDGIMSQIASQDVDYIVFIIKGYSTNKNTVIRAMKELKNINPNITGVVLNNINS